MTDLLNGDLSAPVMSEWAESRITREFSWLPIWVVRRWVEAFREDRESACPSIVELQAELMEVASCARSMKEALERISFQALFELEPDPFGDTAFSRSELSESCRDLECLAESRARSLTQFVSRGRRPAELGRIVARLVDYFEAVKAPVSASASGPLYQLVNIVWAEIYGREKQVTVDAVRKVLSRRTK